MSIEEIEHRLKKAEENIEALFESRNKHNRELAEVTIKLDNILVTLGELKASVMQLQSRPGTLWDKLIFGLIGAAATAFISYILK
jgi:chromosome segregation ATPase